MRLSTRARYGTRALLDLALHYKSGPVLLKEVAGRQQISLSYLQHLIAPMVAEGIVGSIRGVRGGVWLAKPPEEISLGYIISLLEGSLAPTECVDNPETCSRSGACATQNVWGEIKEAIDTVLESMTLQDLVERQKSKSHEEITYQI